MVKKLTALLAISFFLQAPAYARTNHFDGMHLGIALGTTQGISDSQKLLNPNIENVLFVHEHFKEKKSAMGPEAHLIASYGKVIYDKYLLGLEGRIGFHSMRMKSAISATATVGNTVATQYSTNSTLKTSNLLGALFLKPGLLTSPQTLLYGLIGTKVGNFQLLSEDSYMQNSGITANGTASGKKDFTKFGLAVGLGMETYLTERVTFGLDYHYTHYGKLPNFNLTVPLDTPNSTLEVENKNRLYTNSFLVRINYYY